MTMDNDDCLITNAVIKQPKYKQDPGKFPFVDADLCIDCINYLFVFTHFIVTSKCIAEFLVPLKWSIRECNIKAWLLFFHFSASRSCTTHSTACCSNAALYVPAEQCSRVWASTVASTKVST